MTGREAKHNKKYILSPIREDQLFQKGIWKLDIYGWAEEQLLCVHSTFKSQDTNQSKARLKHEELIV